MLNGGSLGLLGSQGFDCLLAGFLDRGASVHQSFSAFGVEAGGFEAVANVCSTLTVSGYSGPDSLGVVDGSASGPRRAPRFPARGFRPFGSAPCCRYEVRNFADRCSRISGDRHEAEFVRCPRGCPQGLELSLACGLNTLIALDGVTHRDRANDPLLNVSPDWLDLNSVREANNCTPPFRQSRHGRRPRQCRRGSRPVTGEPVLRCWSRSMLTASPRRSSS